MEIRAIKEIVLGLPTGQGGLSTARHSYIIQTDYEWFLAGQKV